MSTDSDEVLPEELPEVDPIFIPYSPLETRGEREKSRKMEESDNKTCIICQFKATNESELQVHINAHLDQEEKNKYANDVSEHGKVKIDVSDEDEEEKGKQKRSGGINSNVPFPEDMVEYQGFPVKFKRVVLTGLVETAKQNLYEIKAVKARCKWNKGHFYEWLKENVEESKNYTKSTLKRRITLIEKEAERYVMTKKESSKTGQGKMSKKINSELHSERKDTYIEPKTQEEEEEKELATTFALLKKEIDNTPLQQKQKKVSPQLEAKAETLNYMLEDAEDFKDEGDVDDEEFGDEKLEKDHSNKKIRTGSLKGMPTNMAEKARLKREASVRDFYEKRQAERKDPSKKEKKQSNNNSPLENAVIDLCKVATETVQEKKQAQNPQQVYPQPAPTPQQAPYQHHGFSPYMPYGYPYQGFMGAPSPFMQSLLPMAMPSPQMFQQPMGFQPPSSYLNLSQQRPSTPKHKEAAQLVPLKVRTSGTELDGLSSSECVPATDGSTYSKAAGTSERDPAGNGEIDPSSSELASARGRTSVIAENEGSSEPAPPSGRTSVISAAVRSSVNAQPAKGRTTVKNSTKDKHSKSLTDTIEPQSNVDPSTMNGFGMNPPYQHPYLQPIMAQQAGQMSSPMFAQLMAQQSGQMSPSPGTDMMGQPTGQMSPPQMSPDVMAQNAAGQMSPQMMAQNTAGQMSPQMMAYLMAQQAGQMSPPQMSPQMVAQMAQQAGHMSPPQMSPQMVAQNAAHQMSPPMMAQNTAGQMSPQMMAYLMAQQAGQMSPQQMSPDMMAQNAAGQMSPQMMAHLMAQQAGQISPPQMSPQMVAQNAARQMSPQVIAQMSQRMMSQQMSQQDGNVSQQMFPPTMSRASVFNSGAPKNTGRRHDAAVAAIHRLYEKLNRLVSFPTFEGCFSGDKAFPTFWPMIAMPSAALTPAQADWNTSMSKVRITVEWLFGENVEQFSSLAWTRRQKVLASPVHQWYLNCTFLNNILNTQYPNAISQYFNMDPPSLETYLNVPMGSLQ